MEAKTKTCSLCKQKLSNTEFYKDRSHKDGLTSSCKKCRSRQVSRTAVFRRRRIKHGLPDPAKVDRTLYEKNLTILREYLEIFFDTLEVNVHSRRIGAIASDPNRIWLHLIGETPFIDFGPMSNRYNLFDHSVEKITAIITKSKIELLPPNTPIQFTA